MTPESDHAPGISFTLLENGLDFVLSAVEHLTNSPSQRDLKYAVLHLYSGAVLILKERLLRVDWTLLFGNPEKADKQVFMEGRFRGPDLGQCLERLDQHDIEVSEHHDQQLRLLADKRKRLEHFRITDSTEAIIALTADVLNFLIEFISRELNDSSLDETHAKLLDAIRSKMTDFEAFVTARWNSISSEIESFDSVVACPACLEEAYVIDDEGGCKFCGYKAEDSHAAADEYIAQVMGEDRFELEKDGGVWPRRKCPSCNWDSLVDLGYAEPGSQYICFQCGGQWKPGTLSDCSRCGDLKKESDMSICDTCFAEIVRKDNS